MEFITILEFNHKENEAVLHYCQWTGNEMELEKLFAVIAHAKLDREFGRNGDHVSSFDYSGVVIPEPAVRAHLALPYGSFTRMFQMHTGRFTCPPFTQPVLNAACDEFVDGPMMDPTRCALKLDEYFYGARLRAHFH